MVVSIEAAIRLFFAAASLAVGAANGWRAARGCATGRILYGRRPARMRPVTREGDPTRFWLQVAFHTAAALAGTGLGVGLGWTFVV